MSWVPGDFQSFQRAAPVDDRSVCRHFLEGKCNYGDACRFSHAGFPLTPPVLQLEPFMPGLNGTPANDRSVCRHFLEGKCTYGNACRFSHQGSAENSAAWPTAPSTKVLERPTCRHFLEGKCSYGDACRFSHEDGLEIDAQPTVDDRLGIVSSDGEVLPEDRVLDRLNVKDGDSFSAVVGMLG
eukprot:s3846_g4.t1